MLSNNIEFLVRRRTHLQKKIKDRVQTGLLAKCVYMHIRLMDEQIRVHRLTDRNSKQCKIKDIQISK